MFNLYNKNFYSRNKIKNNINKSYNNTRLIKDKNINNNFLLFYSENSNNKKINYNKKNLTRNFSFENSNSIAFNLLNSYYKNSNSFNINNKNYSHNTSPKIIKAIEKINSEKKIEVKKKRFLKSKLNYLLNNNIILNKQLFNKTKKFFSNNNNNLLKKNKFKENKSFLRLEKKNIFTKKYPNLLNKIKPNFLFEDYYKTPEEIIKNNFNQFEIEILKSEKKYFNLNNIPFNTSKLFHSNNKLYEKLNCEEKNKKNKFKLKNLNKNKNIFFRSFSAKKI